MAKKIETPGMFVGIWAEPEFLPGTITVSNGDVFYFLTDGFTDRLDQGEEAGLVDFNGVNFTANLLMLNEWGVQGDLQDDATGICLCIGDISTS